MGNVLHAASLPTPSVGAPLSCIWGPLQANGAILTPHGLSSLYSWGCNWDIPAPLLWPGFPKLFAHWHVLQHQVYVQRSSIILQMDMEGWHSLCPSPGPTEKYLFLCFCNRAIKDRKNIDHRKLINRIWKMNLCFLCKSKFVWIRQAVFSINQQCFLLDYI